MSDGRGGGERASGARFTVLGSGTLLPDDDRRSAAHLLDAGGRRILLDCGSGTVHGFERHGVEWSSLTHLVFSHYHTDHVGDVAPLLFALKHGVRPPRTDPLTVLGPPGLHDVWEGLRRAFGDHLDDPGFPLEVAEVSRSGSRRVAPGLRLSVHPTPHTENSVAQRWEGEGWAVGYTGDTGPDEALGDFLAGVDLLVCECSVPDDSDVETHMRPRDVAALARRAAPRLLVTTHVYPPLVPDDVPGLVRERGFAGRAVAGSDGVEVVLGGGEDPRIVQPAGA